MKKSVNQSTRIVKGGNFKAKRITKRTAEVTTRTEKCLANAFKSYFIFTFFIIIFIIVKGELGQL